MGRTRGLTHQQIRERDGKIATMINGGASVRDAASAFGLSPQCVNQIRKRLQLKPAAGHRGGRPSRETMEWSNHPGPWTPADELPDDDEMIGPVQRCACGMTLPCHHEPMTIISANWQENHTVDHGFSSESPMMYGANATGNYDERLRKARVKRAHIRELAKIKSEAA